MEVIRPHFIVIDDDEMNNLLFRIIIRRAVPDALTLCFNQPKEGFAFIEHEYQHTTGGYHTVLLLDINMPVWTGWDFLDHYARLDEKIKESIRVFMLSSSIDPKDRTKALENSNVVEFVMKPITSEIILELGRPI
jgi:two-component system chemotaxis response regulator CheY